MKTHAVRRRVLASMVVTLVVVSTPVLAAAGDLDPTFDGDGLAQAVLSSEFTAYPHAVAVQPDGRIVVAGYTYVRREGGDYDGDIALVRHCPTADSTRRSAPGGISLSNLGAADPNDFAFDLALQPDGKIVVTGTVTARFLPDGSLDTGFGAGGWVGVEGVAVALDASGKIVVGSDHQRLVRLTPDGQTDLVFGAQPFGSLGALSELALQDDGSVVVVGSSGGGYYFTVARYLADGRLEPGFGDRGVVKTDFGHGQAAARAVAIGDDRILAAGYDGRDFALVRYASDGTLDPRFGGDGTVTTDFNELPQACCADSAKELLLQPDGKVIAAGYAFTTSWDFGLARYNHDGTLDPTFGGDGKVATDVGGVHRSDMAHGAALQPDGKVVVVGDASIPTLPRSVWTARYSVGGGTPSCSHS